MPGEVHLQGSKSCQASYVFHVHFACMATMLSHESCLLQQRSECLTLSGWRNRKGENDTTTTLAHKDRCQQGDL
eukprot:4057402-Amphidinium_carterae.1